MINSRFEIFCWSTTLQVPTYTSFVNQPVISALIICSSDIYSPRGRSTPLVVIGVGGGRGWSVFSARGPSRWYRRCVQRRGISIRNVGNHLPPRVTNPVPHDIRQYNGWLLSCANLINIGLLFTFSYPRLCLLDHSGVRSKVTYNAKPNSKN